jgi:hypothetical protein
MDDRPLTEFEQGVLMVLEEAVNKGKELRLQ